MMVDQIINKYIVVIETTTDCILDAEIDYRCLFQRLFQQLQLYIYIAAVVPLRIE